MKVLIIGLDSPVQGALEAQLGVRERAYQSVDVGWLQGLGAELSLNMPNDIGVVVNTVTLDSLEQHSGDRAIESLKQLAKVCDQSSIPLLQLSTSQVFDGAASGRHRESEYVQAASLVGEQLVNMEALIQAGCERHIILRTGPVFSCNGDNLLTQLVSQLKQQSPLLLSKTGKSCPQHAQDVARVLSAIIDQLSCGCESWGFYHYSSSEPVSRYQFAEVVLQEMLQYTNANAKTLQLAPIDVLDAAWRWPLLNCEKILFTFGIKQLPWRAFIVPTVKQLFNQSTIEADNE